MDRQLPDGDLSTSGLLVSAKDDCLPLGQTSNHSLTSKNIFKIYDDDVVRIDFSLFRKRQRIIERENGRNSSAD